MASFAGQPLLRCLEPVPSDIEVSDAVVTEHVAELAKRIGLREDEVDLYGRHKAKVHLSVLDRLRDAPLGNYVVCTGINPTVRTTKGARPWCCCGSCGGGQPS